MYNKVILVGNLTRDPELRYLPSGSAICNTALATNRRFKNQAGEQKEEVCFVDISLFGRTAEIANQYLKRGSKILVEGRLKLDTWTDQNGGKRSKHSITVETLQMLDTRGQGGEGQDFGGQDGGYNQSSNNFGGNSNYQQPRSNDFGNTMPQQNSGAGNIPEIDIDDDEIPF